MYQHDTMHAQQPLTLSLTSSLKTSSRCAADKDKEPKVPTHLPAISKPAIPNYIYN